MHLVTEYRYDTQEAETGVICLCEESTYLTVCLIDFMYSHDYTVVAAHDHVRLYALGDKFDIAGLESVALEKLTTAISKYHCLEDFNAENMADDRPGLIEYVFTTTAPPDGDMRRVLAERSVAYF